MLLYQNRYGSIFALFGAWNGHACTKCFLHVVDIQRSAVLFDSVFHRGKPDTMICCIGFSGAEVFLFLFLQNAVKCVFHGHAPEQRCDRGLNGDDTLLRFRQAFACLHSIFQQISQNGTQLHIGERNSIRQCEPKRQGDLPGPGQRLIVSEKRINCRTAAVCGRGCRTRRYIRFNGVQMPCPRSAPPWREWCGDDGGSRGQTADESPLVR